MFNSVTLEISLKPFKQTDDKYIEKVCKNVFEQWRPLIKDREKISIMLWASDGSEILDYTGDLEKLKESILSGLKGKMLEGVTLKANENFDGGFRIAVNNGEAYYDYSADEVINMLSNYLSPGVTALLKEAE